MKLEFTQGFAEQIFDFSSALLERSILDLGRDFAYSLAANLEELRPKVAAFKAARKNDSDHKKYLKGLNKILDAKADYKDETQFNLAVQKYDEDNKVLISKLQEYSDKLVSFDLKAIYLTSIPKKVLLPSLADPKVEVNVDARVMQLMNRFIVDDRASCDPCKPVCDVATKD